MTVQASNIGITYNNGRLSGLSDVSIGNPQASQYLRFDGTKWVAANIDGDIATYLRTQVETNSLEVTTNVLKTKIDLRKQHNEAFNIGSSSTIPRLVVNEYGIVVGATETPIDLSEVDVNVELPEITLVGDVTGKMRQDGTIVAALSDVGITPGQYTSPTVFVDVHGRIVDIQDGVELDAVDTFNGRTGDIVLESSDITDALGYSPYNATENPLGFTTNTGVVETVGGLFTNGISVETSGVEAITVSVRIDTENGILKNDGFVTKQADAGIDYLAPKVPSTTVISSSNQTIIEDKTGTDVKLDVDQSSAYDVLLEGDVTLSMRYVPAGRAVTVLINFTNGEAPGTITWWAPIRWENGTAPSLATTTLCEFTHMKGIWYGKVKVEAAAVDPSAAVKPVSITLDGDSILFGLGIEYSIADRLTEWDPSMIVVDKAASGLTLADMINGYLEPYPNAEPEVYPNGPQPPYADVIRTTEFVLIEAGCNDAFELLSVELFDQYMRKAIGIVLSEGRTPILTGLVDFYVGSHPFVTQEAKDRRDEFNALTHKYAAEYDIPHLGWGEDYQGPEDLLDGIHRTQEVSDRLAMTILDLIKYK